MSLGENIYKLRTGKKLSQEDFASAMEVSRQSVSKWENNMAVPELEKLIKMAKLFEVSLDELVGNALPQPEPAPVPVPIPAPGITTGDLISVVLLILGILFPIFSILTIHIFNNWVIPIIGLYVVPVLATVGAACSSPNSKVLFRIYLFYDMILCIAGFLFMMGAPQLSLFISLPTLGALLYWYNRLDE